MRDRRLGTCLPGGLVVVSDVGGRGEERRRGLVGGNAAELRKEQVNSDA